MQLPSRQLAATLACLVLAALIAAVAMAAWRPDEDGIGGLLQLAVAQPAQQGQLDYRVRSGETVSEIMQRFGLPAHQLIQASRDTYDLARIRAGREITVGYRRGHSHATSFGYAVDEDNRLLVVWSEEAGWQARIEQVEYQRWPLLARFAIESSLWNAAVGAGLRPGDIVRLAEIFQWDVDFNSELRAGDSFALVAEGLYLDGELRKLGEIRAVRLLTQDRELVAVRHEHPDGSVDFYSPDGEATRKPFLRSPLAFSRVSSGFNPKGRFHPVTGKVRPHYGTDFAAPTGTPIRAVGDGVVSRAGTAGGYGLLVRIRHSSGHESGYAHMSKILVRNGQRVKQGQTIGKVGSTGLSTGPHCHYELKYQGRHMDPMTAKLPTSVPLPSGERVSFEAERDRWLPLLLRAAEGAQAAAQAGGP